MTRRDRRVRAVPLEILLLTLLVLVIGAVPANAGVRDFRLGVVENSASGGDLREIGRSGADVLRVVFSWRRAEIEPCGPDYDWTRHDRIVRSAHAGGYRVLPIIIDSPRHVARGGHRHPDPRNSSDMDAYRCYVRALVQRYGRGGTLPLTGVPPIEDWQVWNEPMLRMFTPNGRVNPRQYGQLVKATERVIHRVDPRANIVLAGMPEYVKDRLNVHQYLRQLYRVRGIRQAFDVFAMHPFARNTAGVKGSLVRVRRTLRDLRDRRRPLWVTELSWTTGGGPEFARKSPKGQARELRRAVTMLRRERRRFKIGTVTWFAWRDLSTSGAAFEYGGLYRRNGRPKPSCRAFVRLTGGRRCVSRIDDSTAVAGAQSLEAPVSAAQALEPSPPE